MIKPRPPLPLLHKELPARQRGAALIAAIFVITALAALGGLMTQFLTLGSKQTIDEWYSTQALYAAESGVQWAIWDLTVNGGGGTVSNATVVNNQAWMSTTVSALTVNGTNNLYTITSTGTAGGTASSPRAQRQIVVQYMP
ncbi:MAG TPA: hypothetical protein ENI97_09175 [Gammaproteobacteria bacterium]|nr:hypothetical protein [Gammaproteobacteria bacterium]